MNQPVISRTRAPLRVLQVVAGMNRGGYETFIMNLYRNMDRERVQFDFIHSLEGSFDAEIRELGGQMHKIPFITQAGPFRYARALRAVLAAHPQYRIVHAHMDKFSGMAVREARKMNVPVRIAHSHSTRNEGGPLYGLVKNHYGKMVLPNATHLLACSPGAAAWMFGAQAERAKIVPDAILLEAYRPNEETRRSLVNTIVHYKVLLKVL